MGFNYRKLVVDHVASCALIMRVKNFTVIELDLWAEKVNKRVVKVD
jgi:hypothetical protein